MNSVNDSHGYEQIALEVPYDTDFVAVAIPSDLLLELDVYGDSMRKHPGCPSEVAALPMWAFRSNIIQAAIRELLFDMDDEETTVTFKFDWWKDQEEE